MSVNSRNYGINMHLLISHLLLLTYFVWPQCTCQMY